MVNRKRLPHNPFANPVKRVISGEIPVRKVNKKTNLNDSGNSAGANLTEVTLKAWNNPSTEITLQVPSGSPCKEAMMVSGLMPRDGSPCHCLNENGRIIDNRTVSRHSQFQIGVPPILESVWIEGTNKRGTIGIGHLQDGTKAFVPGVGNGEFVWVYRLNEWTTNSEARCNATRVRAGEEQLFRVGDLIYLSPRYGELTHPVYNSESGLLNRQMRVDLAPGTVRRKFEGIDWIVEITSASPLRGVLRTKEIFVPPHQLIQEKQAEKIKGNGKIKWCDWKKKFGFIKRDDGSDLFFHFSKVKFKVKLGMKVEFEIVPGKKGPRAININKI